MTRCCKDMHALHPSWGHSPLVCEASGGWIGVRERSRQLRLLPHSHASRVLCKVFQQDDHDGHVVAALAIPLQRAAALIGNTHGNMQHCMLHALLPGQHSTLPATALAEHATPWPRMMHALLPRPAQHIAGAGRARNALPPHEAACSCLLCARADLPAATGHVREHALCISCCCCADRVQACRAGRGARRCWAPCSSRTQRGRWRPAPHPLSGAPAPW